MNMTHNERMELIGSMIDVFEDFLEAKGVTIENDEKEGEETEAIIYGNDYDVLASSLETILIRNKLIEEEYSMDKGPVKNAMLELKSTLLNFKDAWAECNSAMSNCFIDCNDYICGEVGEYPFHKSFDEINVNLWVEESIKRLDKEIAEINTEKYKIIENLHELSHRYLELGSGLENAGELSNICYDIEEESLKYFCISNNIDQNVFINILDEYQEKTSQLIQS